MANDNLLQEKYIVGKSSVVGDIRRKKLDNFVYVGEIKRDHGTPLMIGIVVDGISAADVSLHSAQLAIDTLFVELSKSDGDDIPDIIERVVQAANRVVYNENKKNKQDGRIALVIAIIHANRCFIGNVGNCRAYWAQDDGTLLALTRDHTLYNVYGGKPNAENANELVNIIGVTNETRVDMGFYLKPGTTKEQAGRIGYAGLPLKTGESILLCSNVLIKVNRTNRRYAKDEEIISLLQTEYEPNKAAEKMVNVAEGRRPTGSVSAVTIQYLSDDLIAQRKAHSTANQDKISKRTTIGMVAGILVVAIILAFGAFQLRTAQTALPAITPTITPLPTITPTLAMTTANARVDDVRGTGGNVKIGQTIESNTTIFASSDGIKIVVGEQGNQAGVLYWFGGSTGNVNFDIRQMTPMLANGALYIHPGSGKAEIHFAQLPDAMASIEGSQMIVEMVGSDIAVYCFEGQCRLDPGAGRDELKIQAGSKRLYRTTLQKAEDPVVMTYEEMWDWNLKCNFCLTGITTPTPTPTLSGASDDGVVPTQSKKDKQPTSGPPTKIPTLVPPSPIPPTTVPPTQRPTRIPKPTRKPTMPPTSVPYLHTQALPQSYLNFYNRQIAIIE